MPSYIERGYPYQIEPAIPIWWGATLGLGAIAFAISAMTNHRSLILNGVFLPEEAAAIFYWVMSVVGIGAFVMSVHFAIQARLHPRRISLSQDSVSVPMLRWSSQVICITYSAISDIAEIKVRGQRFLYITHTGGRTIINSALFATAADYEPFCQSLADRIRSLRNPA